MSKPVNNKLTLISHKLCPYVQRAVTALEENGVPYQRIDIDLANKPDWFKDKSPLGKVPVLVVNDATVLFESAVISEYINDTHQGKMLADQPLERARQRAWIEFASATLNNIGQLYNADDEMHFSAAEHQLKQKFSQLERNLGNNDYFSGAKFSLIDAAFAPVFRYIEVFDDLLGREFFKHQPRIQHWRQQLAQRPAVIKAVSPDYPERLTEFLAGRDSKIGRLAQNTINLRETA